MTQTSMKTQYKEWTGTSCWLTLTFHPSPQTGVWVTPASAPMQMPISHNHPPGSPPLVQFAPPPLSETWSFKESSCDDQSHSFNHSLFYCARPHLSYSICSSNRRGSHTAVWQRWHQTETSKQLSYPFPLGETPRKHNRSQNAVLNWNSVTDTIRSVLRHNHLQLNNSWSGIFWELGLGGRE